MSSAILDVIVLECGPEEVLRRISDPFWFQALGCVLGFDWHSSGVTTTVCGAIKEAVQQRGGELGLFVAGGKGKVSRKTPQEIQDYGEKFALPGDVERLVYASRMSAKVDNSAVQDGFQLYHHAFFFTRNGSWAVVQQGMNEENHYARRYHWLESSELDFVNEPHAAVCCDSTVGTLNLVAAESAANRDLAASLSREVPAAVVNEFRRILECKDLKLPAGHMIPRAENLERSLNLSYEKCPAGFEDLLSVRGVGPKTLRALSLVAEVAYGTQASYRDPVKYSFAHGGKDGIPYPVDRENYQRSITALQEAVEKARTGNSDKMAMLRKLAQWSEEQEEVRRGPCAKGTK